MKRVLLLKYKKEIILLVSVILVILFFKFIFPLCWPLIIAFLLLIPVYNLIFKLQNRTKIKKSIWAAIYVFLIFIFLLFAIWGILFAFRKICIVNMNHIGQISACCQNLIDKFCFCISDFCGMNKEILIREVNQGIKENSNKFSGQMIYQIMEKSVISVRAIVGFVAVITITAMMIILLTREFEAFRKVIYSKDIFAPVLRIWRRLKKVGLIYLRAELMIMMTITLISLLGLFWAKSEHPFFYAVLAGVLDALPFIGTGIVLVPLLLWNILQENYIGGIILLITYITCALTREFLEPKLLGAGMKVSSVGILISIFAGIKIYGAGGVVLGPITFFIILEIYQELT